MTEKIQTIAKRLDGLKGFLLLNKHGHPYLLKGYKLQTKTIRTYGYWPFKSEKKEVTYISQIEDSNSETHFFDHDEFRGLMIRVNQIIDDRNRYVHMLKELSQMGYTIKRK